MGEHQANLVDRRATSMLAALMWIDRWLEL
jgi:hypothetical protein